MLEYVEGGEYMEGGEMYEYVEPMLLSGRLRVRKVACPEGCVGYALGGLQRPGNELEINVDDVVDKVAAQQTVERG